FLDSVMPFFSGNRFFIPAIVCLSIFLLWRGGSRARVFVPVLFLILALGDGFVINTIKHAVGRPRPYLQLEGVRELLGRGESRRTYMVSGTMAEMAVAIGQAFAAGSVSAGAAASHRRGTALDIPRPSRHCPDVDRPAALHQRGQNRVERRRSVSVDLVEASGALLFQQTALDRDRPIYRDLSFR